MAPFHFPPNSVSDLSHTPDAAANKEDREAGIVVDDDNIIDVAAEKRLLRQLDLRIILAFPLSCRPTKDVLSRENSIILNASTGDSLLQVLHMTRHQFLAVASISLVSHVLFPIPSNYMLNYFSPPSWLAFLVLGSGVSLMIMAVSQNYITLLFFRLSLSAFSIGAGLAWSTSSHCTVVPLSMSSSFSDPSWPSCSWYRFQERSLHISLILASLPLGAAFSGCIAYGVGFLNGIRDL
ncbi:uncharacterized protein ARMOST_20989 [Armillaria ostoyae]|uniref:Major facilitator superfamily (MFS) profile domain-containing protein n=1 Tax=Armillaria ostoyae TaxID=47428 RepID=A0A284S8U9_ARMOS|nr:uncharacterized protein ARMOST_20989 [Armillaria ostoyae]